MLSAPTPLAASSPVATGAALGASTTSGGGGGVSGVGGGAGGDGATAWAAGQRWVCSNGRCSSTRAAGFLASACCARAAGQRSVSSRSGMRGGVGGGVRGTDASGSSCIDGVRVRGTATTLGGGGASRGDGVGARCASTGAMIACAVGQRCVWSIGATSSVNVTAEIDRGHPSLIGMVVDGDTGAGSDVVETARRSGSPSDPADVVTAEGETSALGGVGAGSTASAVNGVGVADAVGSAAFAAASLAAKSTSVRVRGTSRALIAGVASWTGSSTATANEAASTCGAALSGERCAGGGAGGRGAVVVAVAVAGAMAASAPLMMAPARSSMVMNATTKLVGSPPSVVTASMPASAASSRKTAVPAGSGRAVSMRALRGERATIMSVRADSIDSCQHGSGLESGDGDTASDMVGGKVAGSTGARTRPRKGSRQTGHACPTALRPAPELSRSGVPRVVRCPTCRASIPAEVSAARPAHAPFCSPRCQAIDLGKWLGEEHAIAGEPALDDADLEAALAAVAARDDVQ